MGTQQPNPPGGIVGLAAVDFSSRQNYTRSSNGSLWSSVDSSSRTSSSITSSSRAFLSQRQLSSGSNAVIDVASMCSLPATRPRSTSDSPHHWRLQVAPTDRRQGRRSSGSSSSSSMPPGVLQQPRPAAASAADAEGGFLPLADINTLPLHGGLVDPPEHAHDHTAGGNAARLLQHPGARTHAVLTAPCGAPDEVTAMHDTQKAANRRVRFATPQRKQHMLDVQQQQQHVLRVLAAPAAMGAAAAAGNAAAATAAADGPKAAGQAASAAAVGTGQTHSGNSKAASANDKGMQLLCNIFHIVAVLLIGIWQVVVNVTLLRALPDNTMPVSAVKGDAGLGKESGALWGLTVLGAVALLAFAVVQLAVIMSQGAGARAGSAMTQQSRMRFACTWVPILVIILTDFCKLVVLQCIVTKLRYEGQWCGGLDQPQSIANAFHSARDGVGVAQCQRTPVAYQATLSVVFAMVSVAFNTLALYAAGQKCLWSKAVAVLPAALLTFLTWFKPVTALMTFDCTQAHFTGAGDFSLSVQSIIALVSLVLAAALAAIMAYICAELQIVSRISSPCFSWCGSTPNADSLPVQAMTHSAGTGGALHKDVDVWLTNAPPSEPPTARMMLRTVARQQVFLGQLPAIFGLLAPLITLTTLSICSFWLVLDLVAGSVLLASHIALMLWSRGQHRQPQGE